MVRDEAISRSSFPRGRASAATSASPSTTEWKISAAKPTSAATRSPESPRPRSRRGPKTRAADLQAPGQARTPAPIQSSPDDVPASGSTSGKQMEGDHPGGGGEGEGARPLEQSGPSLREHGDCAAEERGPRGQDCPEDHASRSARIAAPLPNSSSGTIVERTRCAPEGKSKKYPGCTSTSRVEQGERPLLLAVRAGTESTLAPPAFRAQHVPGRSPPAALPPPAPRGRSRPAPGRQPGTCRRSRSAPARRAAPECRRRYVSAISSSRRTASSAPAPAAAIHPSFNCGSPATFESPDSANERRRRTAPRSGPPHVRESGEVGEHLVADQAHRCWRQSAARAARSSSFKYGAGGIAGLTTSTARVSPRIATRRHRAPSPSQRSA